LCRHYLLQTGAKHLQIQQFFSNPVYIFLRIFTFYIHCSFQNTTWLYSVQYIQNSTLPTVAINIEIGCPSPEFRHPFHHATYHLPKCVMIDVVNCFFDVCYQFLFAVRVIAMYTSLRWSHEKKSGRERFGGIRGHSPCKINWSAKNSCRNAMLVHTVWHVVPCYWYHEFISSSSSKVMNCILQ